VCTVPLVLEHGKDDFAVAAQEKVKRFLH
jgi:hypothetical protein